CLLSTASATLEFYPLSLHDALPIYFLAQYLGVEVTDVWETATFYSMFNLHPVGRHHIQICKTLSCKIMGEPEITDHVCSRLGIRSEEHTSELQSRENLVCRLLLEKK